MGSQKSTDLYCSLESSSREAFPVADLLLAYIPGRSCLPGFGPVARRGNLHVGTQQLSQLQWPQQCFWPYGCQLSDLGPRALLSCSITGWGQGIRSLRAKVPLCGSPLPVALADSGLESSTMLCRIGLILSTGSADTELYVGPISASTI